MRDIKLGNALLRSAFFVNPETILKEQGDEGWISMVEEASRLEHFRANLISEKIAKLLVSVLSGKNV